MMRATVVITTKNRKEDLRIALRSAVVQTASPEVLVIDDGSTDGTSELVRGEFPTVRLHRAEQSQGLIVQRNRAAEMASGDVIVSIDDDAEFSSPEVVRQTLADFEHPRVAAVAIPFINVRLDPRVHQRAPQDDGVYVCEMYIGTAHAVRRDLFRSIGGYQNKLFHQGEERDFCIRLLDRGFVVRQGRADPINHYESPRRDFRRMDVYGRRNDVLYAWDNVPWPEFPFHLVMTTVRGLQFGWRVKRRKWAMQGLGNGYTAIAKYWSDRNPVRGSTYRLGRLLQKGSRRLEQIEPLLPSIA